MSELTTYQPRSLDDGDQEGWIVAYADLVTLLFIFFSLLLSISAVSRAKFELISEQFNANSTTSLSDLKKQLDQEIARQGLQAEVSTDIGSEGLSIQFSESALFGSAEAQLNEKGRGVMSQFVASLKGIEGQFHLAVEGHTDRRPIHTPQFESNWSLSSARAVNVLHFLQSQGLDEKAMMVRAYADTRPATEPPTDLSKNRRVTLLVY